MNDVYLDVLIFENMIMNYVILHITSLTASRCSRCMQSFRCGSARFCMRFWERFCFLP